MDWKEFAKKDMFASGIGIELQEAAPGTATATEKLFRKRASHYHVDVTKQDGTAALIEHIPIRKRNPPIRRVSS